MTYKEDYALTNAHFARLALLAAAPENTLPVYPNIDARLFAHGLVTELERGYVALHVTLTAMGRRVLDARVAQKIA